MRVSAEKLGSSYALVFIYLLWLGQLMNPQPAHATQSLADAQSYQCFLRELSTLQEKYRASVALGLVRIPKLVFDKSPLDQVIKNLIKPEERTLIIAAPEIAPLLKALGPPVVVVRSIDIETIARVRARYQPAHVIAAGGSTVLDAGRAVSVSGRMDSVPTILSTACISVNKTIARNSEGKIEPLLTQTPDRTVIPLNFLESLPFPVRARWSQSGFGDVFGRISASIDQAFRSRNFNTDQVRANTPKEIVEGLKWVNERFSGSYDEEAMIRLANLSYLTSVEIVRSGQSSSSVGDEHQFYYKIMARHPEYNGAIPTHGQLVALGTLISARAYGEVTGDFSIFNQLRSAFEKLGLPVNRRQLEAIHLDRQVLTQGLSDISGSTGFLGQYIESHGVEICDQTFGTEK